MGGLEGFRHLTGYLSPAQQASFLASVRSVMAEAPLYVPTMPRTGKPFSVRMTNCGPLGWVSDKAGGYRYQAEHPVTGRPWPAMPDLLLRALAGGGRLSRSARGLPSQLLCRRRQDGLASRRGRGGDQAPVVSISLGDDATFHIGGLQRTGPKRRLLLRSGDVVVLAAQRAWPITASTASTPAPASCRRADD